MGNIKKLEKQFDKANNYYQCIFDNETISLNTLKTAKDKAWDIYQEINKANQILSESRYKKANESGTMPQITDEEEKLKELYQEANRFLTLVTEDYESHQDQEYDY